jgi:hypothetical protein
MDTINNITEKHFIKGKERYKYKNGLLKIEYYYDSFHKVYEYLVFINAICVYNGCKSNKDMLFEYINIKLSDVFNSLVNKEKYFLSTI